MTLPYVPGEAMPERAKRDGCECRHDVTRCVHLDDSLLTLVDNSLHGFPCSRCFASGFYKRWCVAKDGDTCAMDGIYIYVGDSEADALAAFYAEERRLLGRD